MLFICIVFIFVSFLVDSQSVYETLSDNASIAVSFDGPLCEDEKLNDIGCSSAFCILPTHGNGIFYVMSVMLHMLHIKGCFGGQAYEDPNLNLRNFIEVRAPFDIAQTTQESIW